MPNSNPLCAICGERDHTKLVYGESNKFYCLSCVEKPENNLIPCASPNCGKYLTMEEATITGSGIMCEAHLREMYFSCDCCKNPLTKKANGRQLQNGKYICDSCFEEKYYICPECGNIHKIDETKSHLVTTKDKKKIKVCDKCFKNNYIVCKTCGENVHKSNIQSFSIMNPETKKNEEISGCSVCIEKKFERCNSCKAWYYKNTIEKFTEVDQNDVEYVYCKRCYYADRVIHEYNFKPKPKMNIGSSDKFKDLFFGVENEIECDQNNSKKYHVPEIGSKNDSNAHVNIQKHVAITVEKIIPEFLYQKRDGSLSYGVEIVSHPASIEYWYGMEGKLKEVFDFLNSVNCKTDTASTAGMHVHVSRKDISKVHKNNISAFVYCNKDQIQKLAGRSGNSYSRFKNISDSSKKTESGIIESVCGSEDRYDAINWRNKHTMEMRMFQSTSKVAQFISNIEFCLASYLFTRENKIVELADENAWSRFCEFIERNEFRHLPTILKEKNIWVV